MHARRKTPVVAVAALLVAAAVAPACGARTGMDTRVFVLVDGGATAEYSGTGGSGGTGPDGGAGAAGAGPTLTTARPIAPLSTSTVTSQTPTLRWELPAGADGAFVELCADRACSQGIDSFTVAGTSGKPSQPLSPGVVFWRVTATTAGVKAKVTSPVWQMKIGHRSAPIDTSWGTTPDVDGDGFADILVGAPGIFPATGEVYVYRGGPAGPASKPTLVVPNPGFGTGFGSALASAGDVDGDGFADVVIAGVGEKNAGAVWLYRGGEAGLSTTPTLALHGEAIGDAFGISVSSVGDVNGDGYADVVVGQLEAIKGPGRAFVFHGGPSGLADTPSATLVGPVKDSAFGGAVAGAGDVNGDGFGDLIVGAYLGTTGAGEATVFLGGPHDLEPAPTWIGGTLDDKFGVSVACAGDIDGDGLSDVVVGAFQTQVGPGLAYVFRGSATSLGTTPSTTLTGTKPGDAFGLAVDGAGDVDGDGYSDLLVGAGALGNTGAAYVYRGSPAGLIATPATTLIGNSNIFGDSLAGAGDLDGDGFDDVLIGNEHEAGYTGAVYGYRGGKGGLMTSPAFVLPGLHAQAGAATALD